MRMILLRSTEFDAFAHFFAHLTAISTNVYSIADSPRCVFAQPRPKGDIGLPTSP